MKQLRLTSVFLSVFLFLTFVYGDENFEVIYTGSKPLPSRVQVGMVMYENIGNRIRDRKLYDHLRMRGFNEWNFPNVIQAGREHRRLEAERAEHFRRFGNMQDSARPGMKYGYGRYGAFAPIAAVAGAAGMLASEGVEASEVREPSASESGLAGDPAQVSTETRDIKPQLSTGAARFVRPTQGSKKVDQRR